MDLKKLGEDNRKLIERFGAKAMSKFEGAPKFYTFQNGLVYSHRDFDKFLSVLIPVPKKCVEEALCPFFFNPLIKSPFFDIFFILSAFPFLKPGKLDESPLHQKFHLAELRESVE